MRIDREYFIRFAVAVALACYDLPTDRAMTSEEAAQLVKWVIDMALGPDASNVQVEPTLMKGDKVVKGIKQLSDFALFLKQRKRYFSHTELVVIEVQTNATLLQLHNQLLKIR